jgi:CelD/BcsL family acetyltransferase involved in cellulose biosynthesis
MAAFAVKALAAPEVTAQVVFGGDEVIKQCAEAWQELCDESRCPPFFRPEWIASYLRAFEPSSEVALFTAPVMGKDSQVTEKHRYWKGADPTRIS